MAIKYGMSYTRMSFSSWSEQTESLIFTNRHEEVENQLLSAQLLKCLETISVQEQNISGREHAYIPEEKLHVGG